MKWALLSVWDKTGIVQLAEELSRHQFNIMSSGGTGKALAEAGIRFTEVSSYTGFPEMRIVCLDRTVEVVDHVKEIDGEPLVGTADVGFPVAFAAFPEVLEVRSKAQESFVQFIVGLLLRIRPGLSTSCRILGHSGFCHGLFRLFAPVFCIAHSTSHSMFQYLLHCSSI